MATTTLTLQNVIDAFANSGQGGVYPRPSVLVDQFGNPINNANPIPIGHSTATQVVDPAGNLQSAVQTGVDAIAASGVPAGAQQLAGQIFSTTFNGAVTGSATSQQITVASTTNMLVGDNLTTGDNVETARVISVDSATQFHIILKNNHANTQTLTWSHLNQARDGTVGDAVTSGIAAEAPYFYYGGGLFERERGAKIFKTIAAVAVTAGTPATIWTPANGKKFRLTGFMVSLSVAGSVIFKDAGAEFIRTPLMAAGIGIASPESMDNGFLSAVANNVLGADVSATGSVSGFVYGTEE